MKYILLCFLCIVSGVLTAAPPIDYNNLTLDNAWKAVNPAQTNTPPLLPYNARQPVKLAWVHADDEILPAIWDKRDRTGEAWCWFKNADGEYIFHRIGTKIIVTEKAVAQQWKNNQGHILWIYTVPRGVK